MNFYIPLLFFVFGTAIGSFLNVVILRLPAGLSLGGRSRCSSCSRTLSAADLVPMFSFLFLKGGCRSCGQKISPRYIAIEFVTGLLFLITWLVFGMEHGYLFLAKALFVTAISVVVFVIDYEHFLILDKVVFFGLALVVLLNIAFDVFSGAGLWHSGSYFINGLVGSIAGAAPVFLLWWLSGGRAMGFGDVKYMLFLGAALGWPLVLGALFVAVIMGGIVGVYLLSVKDKNLKSRIPFGTFLSVACLIILYFGQPMLDWYLALLGL